MEVPGRCPARPVKALCTAAGLGRFRFSEETPTPNDLFAAVKRYKGLKFIIRISRFKEERNMALSKELLEILACPKCKGEIRLNEGEDGLICDQCKLLYEIRDDIPIMLIDEARPLD
jgi:uncharacterized protein YbaR (Trm112 family)